MLASRASMAAAALAAVVAAAPPGAAAQADRCADLLDAAPSSPERTGPDPTSVAVADLDGDGDQDLAVPHRTGVSLLVNDGDGDFAPRRLALRATENRRTVVAGGFGGGPEVDLAVADTAGSGANVLLGDGAGGFAAPLPTPPLDVPVGLAAGDVDGDGNEDLVVTTELGSPSGAPRRGRGELAVLLADGTGRFAHAPGSPRRLGFFTWPVLADVDGDERLDLVVRRTQDRDLAVLRGDGTGAFAARRGVRTGGPVTWTAAADLDGNDDADLVVVAGDDTSVLLGDGRGRFTRGPGEPVASAAPVSATPADFNGDGHTDVAVVNLYRGDVVLALGDGTGRLQRIPAAVERAGRYAISDAVAAGDFDADGRPDLAVVNPRGAGGRRVSVLLNTGAQARPGAQYRPSLAAAAGARRIAAGEPAPITARAACGGNPLRGLRLQLERRVAGAHGGWQRAGARTTGERGAARRVVRPRATTAYRWRSPVADGLRPALSAATTVRVAPVVTVSARRAPSGAVTIAGRVAPAHPRRVVHLQRRSANRWVTVRSARLSAAGRLRFVLVSPRPGTYRVLRPAHRDHATGRSQPVTLEGGGEAGGGGEG
jgi:hypothetical protein